MKLLVVSDIHGSEYYARMLMDIKSFSHMDINTI